MDRFSLRGAMYTIAIPQFTAVDTTDIPVNDSNSMCGFPKSLLPKNGNQFPPELLREVGKLMGTRRSTTSAYHPIGNGVTDSVNDTMAQMLAMSVRTTSWSNCLMPKQLQMSGSTLQPD